MVSPVNDALVEVPETVIVTLTDGANYDLGASISATVTITDQPAPIITIAAIDPSASETGLDPGVFRFTRVGNMTLPLTVNYTRTGTRRDRATSASFGSSITFPAGAATVDRVVTPVADALAEGSETVIAHPDRRRTLRSRVARPSATVMITD